MGARLAARFSRGAKGSASPRARRSSSSAIASSRSIGSATRTSRCCARPAATSRRCRPGGEPASLDQPQLPRAARSCSSSSTSCSRRCRSRARARTTSPTRTVDPLSASTAPRPTIASAVRCSAWRSPNDPVACAAAVAAEIARILREETVRDRKTGVPRAARPGDIAILFRSRTSHREFEHELERARHSDLRLQGPRVLRRRRDQGPLGADAVPRGSRVRPARGGVPALALRPLSDRGPGAARPARSPRR